MQIRLPLVVLVALAAAVGACSSSEADRAPNGGPPGTAGMATSTGSGGSPAVSGSSSGGSLASGGQSSVAGHTSSAGTGGTLANGGSGAIPGGGRAGNGGTSPSGMGGMAGMSRGGSTGAAGSGGGGTIVKYPLGNPAVSSAGCGKPTTVTNGKKTIMSGGQSRSYIIDIPTGYDMNKPYRFFYASHWISAKAEDVVGQNYYFLKPLVEADGEKAIFLAPQALPGNPTGTWDTQKSTDHVLFDDLLAFVKENLCIDVSRVFATGFSFGGMMTYSLSVNHQKDIRAAVGIAPANYNIYLPTKTHQPIAWMQTTGMGDSTCPWIQGSSTTNGSKFIAIEHGKDNSCMVPADIPIWKSGAHVCYDMPGCTPEYPTKVCTFNGPHTNINSDPGSSANWIPQESWKFFKQF